MDTVTIAPHVESASAFKRLLAAHPFVSYFSIAYAGTWILLAPMVLSKDGIGILPFTLPTFLYILLFLLSPFTGPTLAAFLVTDAQEGKAGRRKFLRRYTQWRVGFQWYLAAIFGLPLVYLVIISILSGAFPLADLRSHWTTLFTYYLPSILIFPAIITWGEEPGWRGFAQTRLQERYSPAVASLIVGVLHGLWHLPVFMTISGPVALGPFNLLSFLRNTLIAVGLTFIFTWVFNNAKGSILIAVLIHVSSDVAPGWIVRMIPHIPPSTNYIGLGFYLVFGLLLVILTRGRLGYQPANANNDAPA